MKKIFFISLAFCALTAAAQPTKQDCTEESVANEPGRFLDAHAGARTGGSRSGFSAADIANAQKMMTAFEKVCKPKLQFTGGQAKASFSLNSRSYYDQQLTNAYMYNLGFHKFVCNVQTHKLAIVSEYQGVLRVMANPWFRPAFSSFEGNAAAYKIPANTQLTNAPFIAIFNYYAFADTGLVNAVNKGNRFIDLTDESAGSMNIQVLEYIPGKGYGWYGSNGFVKMGDVSFIYRHAFISHTDIPFFIPVTRKKFLTDMLEFYEREKPELVANMQHKIKNLTSTIAESARTNSRYLEDQKNMLAAQEQAARDILTINEQKKQIAVKLLQSKDQKWLNQPAVVRGDNKDFPVPYNRQINSKEIYGNFYFTEFYTGTDGVKLYHINPDYLKKYPSNGAKPAIIDVMYRFRTGDKFLTGVNKTFINQLDLDQFRKLLD